MALALALPAIGTAHAQRTSQVKDTPLHAAKLIIQCRIELADTDAGRRKTGDAYQEGLCEGVVATTLFHVLAPPRVAALACPPPGGIKNIEALRVLVRYADTHPREFNDDMRVVALKAFRQAWPCAAKPTAP